MVPPLYIGLIILVMIESSTGIALNMYIVFAKLKSRQQIKPCDLIHLTKGMVNVLLQLFLTMEVMIILASLQKFFAKEVLLTSYFSLHTLGYFNYWLTAFLCVYYCSTISNLRFVILVWVKRMITTFLPKLLLLSVMGSFLFSIPSIWETSVTLLEHSMGNSTNNSTITWGALFINCFYITGKILGIYLPFILTFLSIMVTIFVLVRHMGNIKDTNSNFKDPKLQALINATRTMLLFLAVHVSFHLSGYYAVSSLYESIDLVPKIGWFFVLFCPTAEALTIIQASSKLKERFQVIFCRTETNRGNVEIND